METKFDFNSQICTTIEGQKAIDIDKAWSLAYSMYQVGRDNLIPLTKDEFIKAMED